MITTCEDLPVCDPADLPEDEAIAPAFVGVGGRGSAFSPESEKLLDTVETALVEQMDDLTESSRPTLTTDREGHLKTKVVLRDDGVATRESAVRRMEQILERVFNGVNP